MQLGETPHPATSGRLRPWGLVGLVALFLAAFAVYAPALGGGFLWDDQDWIVQNDSLWNWPGLARIWIEPGRVIQYYPLTYTSWFLDARLHGLDPFWMHVENVFLHATLAALFWVGLRRLRVPGAWLAALVFTVHPVHVESVAWLVERKNVLSGVLFAGAVLAWLAYDDSRNRRAWLAALALFLFALLAKTATVMLPVGLWLLTAWRRRDGRRGPLVALAPFFVLALAAAAMTIHMERGEGAVGAEWDLSLAERCALAGRAVWFYLAKLVWPFELAFVYPRWTIDAGALLSWLPLAALAAAAAVCWRQRRGLGAPLGVAGGWYVALLFPVLGLVDFYYMRYAFVADHFQYLASLGPIALAAAGAMYGGRRGLAGRMARIVPAAALGAVALVLGVEAHGMARSYRDVEGLWRETLRRNPDAWLAHANLGNLLCERGEWDAGLAHHRRALAVRPEAFESNNAVGNALARDGRFDEAEECFRAALRVRPDSALTYNNLGAMEVLRRDWAAAAEWFRQALRREPERADVMINLASVLASAPDDAVREPARAVALAERVCARPAERTPASLYVLFNAYAATGRRADAIRTGHEAVSEARAQGDAPLAARIEERVRVLEAAGER